MGSVKGIEDAVLKLSPAELASFREWFAEFDTEQWDRQIEADLAAGRLDALGDKASADLRAGRAVIHRNQTRNMALVPDASTPHLNLWKHRLGRVPDSVWEQSELNY